MMKKLRRILKPATFLLIFALLLSALPPSHAANAVYSRQTLVFNGQAQALDAYNIDGYTYFRLRDIAALCKNTAFRFSLSTDNENRRVDTTLFKDSGDLSLSPPGADLSRSCVKSAWRLFTDGKAVNCSVYNIGGNNFYRLRDLASAIGFRVGYDEAGGRVLVYAEPLTGTEKQESTCFEALSLLSGGKDNYSAAVSMLAAAANDGSARAAYTLAEGYYYGLYGLPVSTDTSAKFALKAAAGANPRGAYLYGLLLWEGKGVKKDRAEAVKQFTASANGGNIQAQSFLSEAYYCGEEVTAGSRRACSYAQSAANFDDPRAQYIMGLCFYNGKGVSRDLVRAAKYFTSAAQNGDVDAMFSLGVCYYNGEGVSFNPYIALELFRQSAEKGHESAAENAKAVEAWLESQ